MGCMKPTVGSHEIGQTTDEQARYKPHEGEGVGMARAGFKSVSIEERGDRSLRPVTPPARSYGGYDPYDSYLDDDY
jgi:hypothetical protein